MEPICQLPTCRSQDPSDCYECCHKFDPKQMKAIFLVNKETRTIRRLTQDKAKEFLKMMTPPNGESVYKVFEKWPTEKEYFEYTGEW